MTQKKTMFDSICVGHAMSNRRQCDAAYHIESSSQLKSTANRVGCYSKIYPIPSLIARILQCFDVASCPV